MVRQHIFSSLILCILISPIALAEKTEESRPLKESTITFNGKKYSIGLDGQIRGYTKGTSSKSVQDYPFPACGVDSTHGIKFIPKTRKAIQLLSDGTPPPGYKVRTASFSCKKSDLDDLKTGILTDIKWHGKAKKRDIESIFADATILSFDKNLSCKEDRISIKLLVSVRNDKKLLLASISGELSFHIDRPSTVQ